MLAPVRVEVKRGRIRHVTPGVVGHNGDVITYLALVRIAFKRIKRIADRNVRRPGNASVSAIGIEKLRIRVVDSIARVVPDSIQPPIWRH